MRLSPSLPSPAPTTPRKRCASHAILADTYETMSEVVHRSSVPLRPSPNPLSSSLSAPHLHLTTRHPQLYLEPLCPRLKILEDLASNGRRFVSGELGASMLKGMVPDGGVEGKKKGLF